MGKAAARMAAQRFPDEATLNEARRGRVRRWLAIDDATDPSPVTVTRPTGWARRRVLTAVAAGVLVGAVATLAIAALAPDRVMPTAAALVYQPVAGNASDLLKDLAAKAAVQPASPGAGGYQYVHTRTWSLAMSGFSDAEIFDARIVTAERELWVGRDGSGRVDITKEGAPVDRLELDGGPGFQTVDSLRAAESTGRGTAQWFHTVREMWTGQVVEPGVQNTLLAILASKPGITTEGETTDRGGRRGIAFSTPADNARSLIPNQRLVIILDPATGMLLDYEEVATENGGLPISTPSSTGYVVWLGSGHVKEPGVRP